MSKFPTLYLNPNGISYLTQLILALLISVYLLNLLWRQQRAGKTMPHSWLAASFFWALTLFLVLLFLTASLTPTLRLYVLFLLNPMLGVLLICLVQFAYHFPAPEPALRGEALLALLTSSLYTLGESAFAVYRYGQLQAGNFLYRPDWADAVVLLLSLWIPWAFIRQMTYLLPPPTGREGWIGNLRRWLVGSHPDWQTGRHLNAVRAFVLIFLGTAALNLFNFLHTFYLLSGFVANASISIGILTAMLAFAAVYFNALPAMTSFMIKLVGVTLTILFAAMGMAGWLISPYYEALYEAHLPEGRALRFTPNGRGGYDAEEVPFSFDEDLGENLNLDDGQRQPCSQPIHFTFLFFSRPYAQIFACNDGTLAMGNELPYRHYQYRYGAGTPLILALLSDLDPTSGDGGVFARQEADRLLITWNHLQGFRRPNEEYTFQAALYPNGSFELRYKELPDHPLFYPNDDPGASVWAIGVMPGDLQADEPAQVNFGTAVQSWQSGPEGMVQDYVLEFHQHLNLILNPLAGLIIATTLAILLGLQPLLYVSVIKPLNALLAGLRRVEAGDYAINVPVQSSDEIGYLTQVLNKLSHELGGLIDSLEHRVAVRTAEIEQINAQLSAEILEHEQAQDTITLQQRQLAAIDERERLSRELHDGLGQTMGYINTQAQAIESMLSKNQSETAMANLKQLAQAARSAHDDIRRHILGLRGYADADVASDIKQSRPLRVLLEEYLARIRERYALQTHLWMPEENSAAWLPPPVEEQALRIVQEALTNVGKHAQARRVDVEIRLLDRHLQIEIADDGIGFDVAGWFAKSQSVSGQGPSGSEPHFGLSILQERATQAGGTLEIRSAPGQGTRIIATLPRWQPTASEEATPSCIRVLLADDSPLFLDGLRNLLLARGVTVVGTANNGLQAVEKTRLLRPDVAVLDLNMPGCNGLEATRLIKAEMPEIKVVILTVAEDEQHLFDAIQSGASGYLLKSLEANQFISLLTDLMHGEAALSAGISERLLAEFARRSAQPASSSPASLEILTHRQQEILRLVAAGHTYKEIGLRLGLTEKAIKYHMGQVIERLKVENRSQAVALASKHFSSESRD